MNDASRCELVHLSGRRSANTIRACGVLPRDKAGYTTASTGSVVVSRNPLQGRGGPYTSFCSSRMAPTSRTIAASFGNMPTTFVRRLISPFGRSIGLVECSFTQCAGAKSMYARTSSSASSINVASFGRLGRICSVTLRHCAFAAALVSCAKIVPMKAAARRRP